MTIRLAHFHGLQSSPNSHKAQAFRQCLARYQLELLVPDLRQPDFSHLSLRATYAHLERELDLRTASGQEHDAQDVQRWILIGSSLGGHLAARLAERFSHQISGLLLLCPALDLKSLWDRALSAKVREKWRMDGSMPLADSSGELQPFHYGFYEEVQHEPSALDPQVPTRVIHGRADLTVPIEDSRAFVAKSAMRSLEEVEDDHALAAHVPTIVHGVLQLLREQSPGALTELEWPDPNEPTSSAHWDFFGPTSQPTAAHFLKHLDEFMNTRGYLRPIAGLDSRAQGHCEVWMRIPARHVDAIRSALRPHRFE
jgi:pimeloyl-ACP methyl ester carboxylesterase